MTVFNKECFLTEFNLVLVIDIEMFLNGLLIKMASFVSEKTVLNTVKLYRIINL